MFDVVFPVIGERSFSLDFILHHSPFYFILSRVHYLVKHDTILLETHKSNPVVDRAVEADGNGVDELGRRVDNG